MGRAGMVIIDVAVLPGHPILRALTYTERGTREVVPKLRLTLWKSGIFQPGRARLWQWRLAGVNCGSSRRDRNGWCSAIRLAPDFPGSPLIGEKCKCDCPMHP